MEQSRGRASRRRPTGRRMNESMRGRRNPEQPQTAQSGGALGLFRAAADVVQYALAAGSQTRQVANQGLNAAGFTRGGVRADSLASAVHSSIGRVERGSSFSSLQSAGSRGVSITHPLVIGSTILAGFHRAASLIMENSDQSRPNMAQEDSDDEWEDTEDENWEIVEHNRRGGHHPHNLLPNRGRQRR